MNKPRALKSAEEALAALHGLGILSVSSTLTSNGAGFMVFAGTKGEFFCADGLRWTYNVECLRLPSDDKPSGKYRAFFQEVEDAE